MDKKKRKIVSTIVVIILILAMVLPMASAMFNPMNPTRAPPAFWEAPTRDSALAVFIFALAILSLAPVASL